MSKRAYHASSLSQFLLEDKDSIIGALTARHSQDLTHEQTGAWRHQVDILQSALSGANAEESHIYFEFIIPRMGKRVDVLLIHHGIIFILEFKVHAKRYYAQDLRQTQGYALDLKNFHLGSHDKVIIPILVATNAPEHSVDVELSNDRVCKTLLSNAHNLEKNINSVCQKLSTSAFDTYTWESSPYHPTPTIVEAAQALYANHKVEEISRSEASNQNIEATSKAIFELIHEARLKQKKIICFVTGVPGAGKTLVGLNIANTHSNPSDSEYAVFLSGNGPLVSVLTEALARDKARRESITKSQAQREVKQFIQSIHHFRDDHLSESDRPSEGVLLYDEAQRAWDAEQASSFMQRKRGLQSFHQSEPEFLLQVMDRRDDWAVIIALIGGGQEINKGEAGLSGWINALQKNFAYWEGYYSPELLKGDYISDSLNSSDMTGMNKLSSLHLATSMRSFRAEHLSTFIHHIIHGDSTKARKTYSTIEGSYPIAITRSLASAKKWVRDHRRGNESSGVLASSNGIRLKPNGIFVKNKIDPAVWFLNPIEDIRSCHALEDCVTEFDVQGLELDWCIVAWDADYRFNGNQFEHWRFVGTKWTHRNKEEDKRYLANAYRVLLTRARQGMVIYIPKGDRSDNTRPPEFYDPTFNFLKNCGLTEV
ncbi:conserved hypothetical protein [gamma proteobacterium HTCC5015]|nr:conserved hypothetical protein [gamma proteobacterium HTCC5015]